MARYAFEDPMAGAQPRSGGGWKQLFWFAVAFTGLGYLDDSTPTAVHFLEDAQGSAGGGATVVVTDNITPQ